MVGTPAASRQSPIRVAYIVGTGHSGSTVLDTVLGNHDQIEGVGELTNLVRSAWPLDHYCACGERARRCPFWKDVSREWRARLGTENPAEYATLQEMFERIHSWRRLASERRQPSPAFQRYAEYTRTLFLAIRTVAGRPIVVDSSKLPSRGLALSLVPGIDLRLVHLVRDPRGVAWSLRKPRRKDLRRGDTRDRKPRPAWRSAAAWVLFNHRSARLCREVQPGRAVVVRYEDLMASPEEGLNRIGAAVGVDLTGVGRAFASGAAMAIRHTIAGNRLRMAGTVALRPDLEWRARMPARMRLTVRLVAGWLMWQYGYR